MSVSERERFADNTTLGRMLGEYRWFRRWVGGHWERWYTDVVHGDFWYRVDGCRAHRADRPTPICRGTPTCEEWPSREAA